MFEWPSMSMRATTCQLLVALGVSLAGCGLVVHQVAVEVPLEPGQLALLLADVSVVASATGLQSVEPSEGDARWNLPQWVLILRHGSQRLWLAVELNRDVAVIWLTEAVPELSSPAGLRRLEESVMARLAPRFPARVANEARLRELRRQ